MSISCKDRRFDSTCPGESIRYLTWKDEETPPKAIALIAHGVCEHIDRFDGIAKALVKCGYVVYGEDHLGHGLTAAGEPDSDERDLRKIGKCPKNADKYIITDMHKMRDIAVSENPGLPEIIVGHSMGSFVAKLYCANYGSELSAAVFCGSGDFFGSGFRAVIYPLRPLFYSEKLRDREVIVKNNVLSTWWLSRDKENRRDYLADELITKYYTPGLMAVLGSLAARSAGYLWSRKMPKDLPVFVVAGTQDIVGFCTLGVRQADKCMDLAGVKDHTTKYYKGYRHELFRDDCKAAVYSDITDWLTEKGLPGT